MIREIKNFTCRLVAGANVATIVVMLFVGYSGRLDPASHPVLTNAGLAFPVFLLINLAFLVFWIMFKPRMVLIPFVGFLVCYQPVREYTPFNISHEPPAGSIKVLSYNVWYYIGWEDREQPNPILEYIVGERADIVCLQESSIEEHAAMGKNKEFCRLYPYRDTSLYVSGDVLAVYSRFPIKRKERIVYESKSNHSTAFTLDIDGEEVVVINNHFETTGLTKEDKMRFKTMLKGRLRKDSAEVESKKLIDKLGEASQIRAPQARAVASYIDRHAGKSIICVGDFNDSPLSYTHRKVAEKLTDCYVSTANGPGISYHHSGFFVRIDNIFCSEDWTPYGCKVDNKIDASDHYPISCWLKKRPKR